MTPLHWAVDKQHVDVVMTLLKFSARIDLESRFFMTPLDIAQEGGRPDMLEMLQGRTDGRTDGRTGTTVPTRRDTFVVKLYYHRGFVP